MKYRPDSSADAPLLRNRKERWLALLLFTLIVVIMGAWRILAPAQHATSPAAAQVEARE